MATQQAISSIQSIGSQEPMVSQSTRRLGTNQQQRQTGFRTVYEARFAHALGWLSIGLGLAQLVAPRKLGNAIGVNNHKTLMRMVGLREIASGVGILINQKPSNWLWSRIGGDMMDLALLGMALRSHENSRGKVAGAAFAVAGVTALDLICTQRVSRHPYAIMENVQPDGAILVEKSFSVNRSPADCYQFWRSFDNLPRFMRHLRSVEITSDTHSHWVAEAPAGTTVEWDAEVINDRPNELLEWRSLPGADVENAGSLRFEVAPAGRGTVLRVQLFYRPPGGAMGAAVAKLFGEEPEQQVQEDLRRFKQLMETGEIPTTEGQPAGRRSVIGRLLPF
ncbi:MAG: SRPBCC family protein [Pseudomonadota bacterium]